VWRDPDSNWGHHDSQAFISALEGWGHRALFRVRAPRLHARIHGLWSKRAVVERASAKDKDPDKRDVRPDEHTSSPASERVSDIQAPPGDESECEPLRAHVRVGRGQPRTPVPTRPIDTLHVSGAAPRRSARKAGRGAQVWTIPGTRCLSCWGA
jgi:hypothetical protein